MAKLEQQKQYFDENGTLIKCTRCGSKKITTRGVGSGLKRQSYYCKVCTRLFSPGRNNRRYKTTPKDVMNSYVACSREVLAWSKRYSSWFHRLDKSLPWQPLETKVLIDELKIYISQKLENHTPTFFNRCVEYLKDHLGDENVNPDPFTYTLGNPPCPHCGASHTRGKGKRRKRQYYRCVNCDRGFTGELLTGINLT